MDTDADRPERAVAGPSAPPSLREASVTARAAYSLVAKLRQQCRQIGDPAPLDAIEALTAGAEEVSRRLTELGEGRTVAKARPPRSDGPAGASVEADDDEDVGATLQSLPVSGSVPETIRPRSQLGDGREAADYAAPSAPMSTGAEEDAIRVTAVDMATAGHSRAEVDAQLRDYFGAGDDAVATALDEVFGEQDTLAGSTAPEHRGWLRGWRRQ